MVAVARREVVAVARREVVAVSPPPINLEMSSILVLVRDLSQRSEAKPRTDGRGL